MLVNYCESDDDEEEESESYVLTMREVDVHHRTPASIPKMSQIKRTPIPLTNSWRGGGMSDKKGIPEDRGTGWGLLVKGLTLIDEPLFLTAFC